MKCKQFVGWHYLIGTTYIDDSIFLFWWRYAHGKKKRESLYKTFLPGRHGVLIMQIYCNMIIRV